MLMPRGTMLEELNFQHPAEFRILFPLEEFLVPPNPWRARIVSFPLEGYDFLWRVYFVGHSWWRF